MGICKLICLNSSSSGNCYVLDCNGEKLLQDLGVDFKEVLNAIKYDVRSVRGCLATHL